MNLFLFCMLDQNGILKTVQGNRNSQKHELSIHLEASLGLPIETVLQLPDSTPEGFMQYNQRVYWYCTMDGFSPEGCFLFLTDAPVMLHYFKEALDQAVEGIQIYDEKGDFIYLNKTCERMENLSQEKVAGRHILEVYEVDKEYSTVMNTLKRREAVKDRCGIFQSKEGQPLYSINTGIPVMLDRFFLGAIALVYDASTFSEIDHKRNQIQQYLKENNKPIRINDYVEQAYDTFDDIIGESAPLKTAVQLAKRVAVNDVSVLLYGETGVGKEIFAQSIHTASPRKMGEFVAINCAALPSSIVESLLFGTTKGAFTGSTEKKGLFELADGGTLFLDEINSMDIALQSKLLRVIQEKNFRRLGSTETIHCNVRFITAISESPEQAIANNHLREDLFYRLGTIVIEIPPLRERGQDILLLAHEYLAQLSKKYFRSLSGISQSAEAVLQSYRWPGNVRELFQALEYACNMTEGDTIELEHLPGRLPRLASATGAGGAMENTVVTQTVVGAAFESLGGSDFPDAKIGELLGIPTGIMTETDNSGTFNLQEKLDAYERQVLEQALIAHECNITKTAESLGIKRQNLQYRMKKCGIKIGPQITA